MLIFAQSAIVTSKHERTERNYASRIYPIRHNNCRNVSAPKPIIGMVMIPIVRMLPQPWDFWMQMLC